MSIRRRPKPKQRETHNLLCPVCFSVKGEPCREKTNGKARWRSKIHPQRRVPLDKRTTAPTPTPGPTTRRHDIPEAKAAIRRPKATST